MISKTSDAGSEIERMRKMIRDLADMLEDRLRAPGIYSPSEAHAAVFSARAYLAGPAYDFKDPAQRREERNTGTNKD